MTNNNHHFDLASALVDEAAGHLIGRDDADTIRQAFGVELEIFSDTDYCSIEAREGQTLLAAATAVMRPGGALKASIDMFRAGDLMFWATQHQGADVMFWAKGREHYNLTAKAGSDAWVVSTFSADTPFDSLQAALAFVVAHEAAAVWNEVVA